MDDDDILGRLEADAAGAEAGNSDPGAKAPDVAPEPAEKKGKLKVDVAGLPTSAVLMKLTPKAAALEGMPAAWRERIIADAAEMGIIAEQDTGWFLIRSMFTSFAAAAGAGAAVAAFHRGLESLPQRMLDGAKMAGADVVGEVKTASQAGVAAIQDMGGKCALGIQGGMDKAEQVIKDASVLGADRIKDATSGLIGKLDAAVEQKKSEGAAQWAMVAEKAAVASAKTALGKMALRSRAFTLILLLLGAMIGGAGVWAARTISGDYLPAGVQTFQSPAGSDFIRVQPGRATIGQAIRCGADLCIPLVPSH
ncbi:MAG: hypothetical protein ACYCS8_12745 [Acidithiobacillus sp.]